MSDSFKASSNSSNGGDKRAEGRYRVTEVAQADAGKLRLKLAREGAEPVELTLPQQALAARAVNVGDEVQATPQARLDYLLRDYAYLGDDRDALAEVLGRLKELQGKETVARWQQWAMAGELPSLFAELMALHYDPHYQRSHERHFHAWSQRGSVTAPVLDAAGIEALARQVAALER